MKVDLGSGRQAMEVPDHVHVDLVNLPHIDYVWDLNNGLPRITIGKGMPGQGQYSQFYSAQVIKAFADNTVDEFRAHHIFEHIKVEKFINLMNEIWEALKPDGVLKVYVPNAAHVEAAWSDPTHVRAFTARTFWYFTQEGYAAFAYTDKTWTILNGYPKINGSEGDWWEIEVHMTPNKSAT